ncbi:MAG: hypothetical protein JWO67_6692 [Streptosporangiaceae bacterium]|nr:hypothetical protein [Streptosporangiaceae bacterium]
MAIAMLFGNPMELTALQKIGTKGPESNFYETITPRGDTLPYTQQCVKGSLSLTLCRVIHEGRPLDQLRRNCGM